MPLSIPIVGTSLYWLNNCNNYYFCENNRKHKFQLHIELLSGDL